VNLRQSPAVQQLVDLALSEDIAAGDVTTEATIDPEAQGAGRIVAREAGVVAGLDVAALVFEKLDPAVRFERHVRDGDEVQPGQPVATVSGPLRALLTGERVALNFLQHLSGVATKTRRLAALIAHTKAKLLDTRKTTPGMRLLEKYAVRCGGGENHRMNLAEAVLLKDNHIAAVGGVAEAVRRARERAPRGLRVQVEVSSIAELEEALSAGAHAVLLDNMSLEDIRRAVELCAGRCFVEASGGVTEKTIVAIAEAGVDAISCGALTHSAPALDMSLELLPH